MVNVQLQAEEGSHFIIDFKTAMRSKTIKTMIEALKIHPNCQTISLPRFDIQYAVLDKVLEYCAYHQDDPENSKKVDEQLAEFDKKLMNSMELKLMLRVINAAEYLGVRSLRDLSTKTAANLMKGKTPDEIYANFGIKNNISEEDFATFQKILEDMSV